MRDRLLVSQHLEADVVLPENVSGETLFFFFF